jgi:hypothetical protein
VVGSDGHGPSIVALADLRGSLSRVERGPRGPRVVPVNQAVQRARRETPARATAEGSVHKESLAGLANASFLPADYVLAHDVRWAAAEGVSEDVIAAVLLLHEHSVEEIVPQLSPLELEKVIELVGRAPRLYPRGILEALDQHSLTASVPVTKSVPPNASSKEEATPSASATHPPRGGVQPSSRTGPDGRQSPTERGKRVERPW